MIDGYFHEEDVLDRLTQDDLILFEEVTGIELDRLDNGQRSRSLPFRCIDPGCMFYYEFSHADMWSWEIIESVILLAHSIPRKDLLEMLR